MDLRHRRRGFGLAAAIMAACVAGQAHAQQDDRFTLRVGAMDASATSTLSARTNFMGQDLRYSQEFDLGSDEISPRIDGVFRFSDRQRLVFDYFSTTRSRRRRSMTRCRTTTSRCRPEASRAPRSNSRWPA